MNVLILGCGFIGNNLAVGFHESDYNISIIDKEPIKISPSFKTYRKNIKYRLDDIFIKERPEIVFYTIRPNQSRRQSMDYYIKTDKQ